ncbi:MAG: ComF family protein [Ruminococcus sp.]
MKSRRLHRLKLLIASVFFPERCPYCNKVIKVGECACENCKESFPQKAYRTYAIGGYDTVSVFPYSEPYSTAVKHFKFRGRRQYSHAFALKMAEAFRKEYNEKDFDLITYVPLHPKRYRERGYNQCEYLARELSYLLDIPAAEALIKTRHTQPQHEVKAEKKSENVKGTYRVCDKSLVKGKRILLIDDIITTGNTLGECAKTLSSKGAEDVACLTYALTTVKFD